MDEHTLRKRMNMFQNMKQLKRSERLSFIKNCPNECIHALCEICFNLLHQSIKLTKDKKYQLKKSFRQLELRFAN